MLLTIICNIPLFQLLPLQFYHAVRPFMAAKNIQRSYCSLKQSQSCLSPAVKHTGDNHKSHLGRMLIAVLFIKLFLLSLERKGFLLPFLLYPEPRSSGSFFVKSITALGPLNKHFQGGRSWLSISYSANWFHCTASYPDGFFIISTVLWYLQNPLVPQVVSIMVFSLISLAHLVPVMQGVKFCENAMFFYLANGPQI